MSDLYEELVARLREVAARVDVFAYEYENGNVARVVWQAASDLVGRAMRRGSAGGASVWRTKDAATETRWFVAVVDDGLDLRDRVEWGDGKPTEMSSRERRSLVDRHLARMLEQASAGGGPFVTHFGSRGAELRSGGDLRPRIGRDE